MRVLVIAVGVALVAAGCSYGSHEQVEMDVAETTAQEFMGAWQSTDWDGLSGSRAAREFAMANPIDDSAWRCRWVDTWTDDNGWFQCFRPSEGEEILWVMVGRGSTEVHEATATLPPKNMDGFVQLPISDRRAPSSG